MKYIVFYKKTGSDCSLSFFYTISLQQILDFYNMFNKDLECLYLMLYENQDTHVTIIERNKSLVGINPCVKDLNFLIRDVYKLDRDFLLL